MRISESCALCLYGKQKKRCPDPEYLAGEMRKRYLYIFLGDAMILSEPEDTHLTVFNPDPGLLEMIRAIASGEGLFVWQPVFPEAAAE